MTRVREPSPLPGGPRADPADGRGCSSWRSDSRRSAGQDPDTVITGRWDDPALWSIGAPRAAEPSRPTHAARRERPERGELPQPHLRVDARALGLGLGRQHLRLAVEHRDQVARGPTGRAPPRRTGGSGSVAASATSSPSTPSPVSAETGTEPGIPAWRGGRAREPAHQVDLVERQHLGDVGRADLLQHAAGRPRSGPPASGDDASATCTMRSESVTSSSVERNASTRSCGSFDDEADRVGDRGRAARPAGRSGGSSGRAWRRAGRPRSRRRP